MREIFGTKRVTLYGIILRWPKPLVLRHGPDYQRSWDDVSFKRSPSS
jgi:hypothetical protein